MAVATAIDRHEAAKAREAASAPRWWITEYASHIMHGGNVKPPKPSFGRDGRVATPFFELQEVPWSYRLSRHIASYHSDALVYVVDGSPRFRSNSELNQMLDQDAATLRRLVAALSVHGRDLPVLVVVSKQDAHEPFLTPAAVQTAFPGYPVVGAAPNACAPLIEWLAQRSA